MDILTIDYLANLIYQFQHLNKGESPQYITINIDSYYELRRELKNTSLYYLCREGQTGHFMGIKIITSRDVERGLAILTQKQ
jgi:hypothetical protein